MCNQYEMRHTVFWTPQAKYVHYNCLGLYPNPYSGSSVASATGPIV